MNADKDSFYPLVLPSFFEIFPGNPGDLPAVDVDHFYPIAHIQPLFLPGIITGALIE
jgi:hypothetical protein